MPYVTMLVGVILAAIGATGYFGTGTSSVTALIPTFLGVPLVLLGALALNERFLKHAMHAAAAVGLVGFLGAGAMAAPKLPTLISEGVVTRPDGTDATRAVQSQAATAAVCGVFEALCVNSFIQTRRRRKDNPPPAV